MAVAGLFLVATTCYACYQVGRCGAGVLQPCAATVRCDRALRPCSDCVPSLSPYADLPWATHPTPTHRTSHRTGIQRVRPNKMILFEVVLTVLMFILQRESPVKSGLTAILATTRPQTTMTGDGQAVSKKIKNQFSSDACFSTCGTRNRVTDLIHPPPHPGRHSRSCKDSLMPAIRQRPSADRLHRHAAAWSRAIIHHHHHHHRHHPTPRATPACLCSFCTHSRSPLPPIRLCRHAVAGSLVVILGFDHFCATFTRTGQSCEVFWAWALFWTGFGRLSRCFMRDVAK